MGNVVVGWALWKRDWPCGSEMGLVEEGWALW
jgi:hypothetical protein